MELNTFILAVEAEMFGSPPSTDEGRLCECGSYSASKHKSDIGYDKEFGKKIT